MTSSSGLLFSLATVLVAPVVLHRVIQVVAHRVQQPEVVEQECDKRAKGGCIYIVEVIFITALPHAANLHQQRENPRRCRQHHLLVDLAVMGQARLGIVQDKHQRGDEV